MRQKANHRRHKQNCWKLIPVCVAQLECPLSPAITESGAPPLCKTLSLTITGMSTTLSKTGRRDENLHNRDIDHEEVLQRAESRRISQQLQLWETTVSSTPAPLHDRHAEDVTHLVRGMQLRSNSFLHCLTQALSLAQQRACRLLTKNCNVQHSVDERI